MEKNKDEIVALIGEKKYNQELEVLKQVVESDSRKGGFVAKYGDVDTRSKDLLDKDLSEGFKTMSGVKGSKLSGG